MKALFSKREQEKSRLRRIQERELGQLKSNIERERITQNYSVRVRGTMEQAFRANWRDGPSHER
jgi:hypothetical protein